MNFFFTQLSTRKVYDARQYLLSFGAFVIRQLKKFLSTLQHPRREVNFCG